MSDVSRPVPFLRAARASFELALEGMLWSRRSLMSGLLLALPVAFGLLFRTRSGPVSGLEMYGLVVVFYYIGNCLPLVALLYASSLVAEEVEGRTITYLLSRPVTRAALLAGKFAAYLVATLTLSLPPLVVSYFLFLTVGGTASVRATLPDLLVDVAVCALALLSYGALFTLLGVVLKRPALPGLLFVYVWEFVYRLPGDVPRATLTAYLRSLVRHRPAEEDTLGFLFTQVQPVWLSLTATLGATLLLGAAAALVFSKREYVLEQ